MDTNRWIMYTFYVVLVTSAVTQAAQNRGNDNHGVISKVSLMSGALALILLLFMIGQVLGWFLLVLWILYLLNMVTYEWVGVDAFDKLKNASLKLYRKLKDAIFGQTEERLPV